jgi:hypothetical protein
MEIYLAELVLDCKENPANGAEFIRKPMPIDTDIA